MAGEVPQNHQKRHLSIREMGFFHSKNNLKNMMIFATIIGIIITFFGSILSLNYNLPPGATIVISLAILFIIAISIKNLKQVVIKPFD